MIRHRYSTEAGVGRDAGSVRERQQAARTPKRFAPVKDEPQAVGLGWYEGDLRSRSDGREDEDENEDEEDYPRPTTAI